MIKIRTDLALEAREIIEESSNSSEIPGVKTVNKELDDCTVTIVDVLDEQGAQIMNKGIGRYVTLESKLMKYDDDESRNQIINYLADELKDIFGDEEHKKTLVIGLGNWNITSDALGPKAVSKTLVTRHIFKNYNKDYDDDFTEVSALSPGVMGITGLETSETVKAIVDTIKPDRVVAIDALASRKMDRVNSTIQISTAGISPGGGVGNKMYNAVKFSKGTQAQFDQIKDKSNIYKVDCYLNNDNGMIYFVIPSGVKPLKMEFDNNEEETQKEMNPFL